MFNYLLKLNKITSADNSFITAQEKNRTYMYYQNSPHGILIKWGHSSKTSNSPASNNRKSKCLNHPMITSLYIFFVTFLFLFPIFPVISEFLRPHSPQMLHPVTLYKAVHFQTKNKSVCLLYHSLPEIQYSNLMVLLSAH